MAGFRITSLAVALSALVTGAQAAHASPDVAILGLEVVDGGEGLDQQTTQRAAWLTDELRAHAATDSSPFALAPGSDKDLLEMKLLSGCADEALGCMASIGRELGAERLLYGKLQKGQDGYRVSLTLLDTGGPAVESTTSDRIPFTEASKSGMRAWARSLYNELTGVAAGGVLVVETNAGSGTVFVDGRPRASLDGGAARIADLEEGIHTVSIEADGHAPYAERVTIIPGEEEAMSIALDPLGSAGGDSRLGYKIGFGAAALSTAATGGAWLFSYMQLRSARCELEPHKDNPSGPCADNEPEGDADEIIARGERHRYLAPAFGAAAALSAIASGYFYYKGFGGGGGAAERDPKDDSDTWSVNVAPRFGPDLVGAGLRLEF